MSARIKEHCDKRTKIEEGKARMFAESLSAVSVVFTHKIGSSCNIQGATMISTNDTKKETKECTSKEHIMMEVLKTKSRTSESNISGDEH